MVFHKCKKFVSWFGLSYLSTNITSKQRQITSFSDFINDTKFIQSHSMLLSGLALLPSSTQASALLTQPLYPSLVPLDHDSRANDPKIPGSEFSTLEGETIRAKVVFSQTYKIKMIHCDRKRLDTLP